MSKKEKEVQRRIAVDIPASLKERFNKSRFRKEAKTDGEGVRSALRFALDQAAKRPPSKRKAS